MKKITKITPEQASRFGEWAERWIKIGLSTEPADFDRATAAALRAYIADGNDHARHVLGMRNGCDQGQRNSKGDLFHGMPYLNS